MGAYASVPDGRPSTSQHPQVILFDGLMSDVRLAVMRSDDNEFQVTIADETRTRGPARSPSAPRGGPLA